MNNRNSLITHRKLVCIIKSIDFPLQQSYNPKELKNFHKECLIQQQLRHPNIIRMLTSFETVDHIVVVTECADIDLSKFMKKFGQLAEEKVQQLTWDLISAMYYLHSNRVVHRDIKPENILLNEDGTRARLCDFGLARRMTTQTYLLISMKGTPLYMAPEVINCVPYDYKADFWSIGCVIYEMLVGKPPFTANSIVDLLRIHEKSDINWPLVISDECLSFLKVSTIVSLN